MKDTLVSLEVSRRQQEKEKLRQSQQSAMNRNRVERDARDFHRSVSASNDKYMRNALSKVRESKVTHHESLTRINGTWFHNQKMKP